METFLNDYIKGYTEYASEEERNYMKECYEKLEPVKYKRVLNSVILVKRYKGGIYREDISIINKLSDLHGNEDVSNEEIKSLYENNYLSYDEFVKIYDNCIDERDINHFDLYLIDHLQPTPVDIKIALKD
jgi:hypothetical protein